MADRNKSYIEIAAGMAVAAAAIVYIWNTLTSNPPEAPIATAPGAAQSKYPQAVTGRQLPVYVSK